MTAVFKTLFALNIDKTSGDEALIVQLVSKIDEAGTHTDSPYMTMGGYSALLNQWSRFDHKWNKTLRKHGLSYFHVKEHGDHPFALKGPQIADDNLMFGFVVRLDRADYTKSYRTGGWGGKAQPDSMYGLCFRYCLSLVWQVAKQELSQSGLVLNFLLEDGHPNSGGPTEIIKTLKKKRISGLSEFLGVAVTGGKKQHAGLQAADGLASGAWHLEALGMPTVGSPKAPSLETQNLSKSVMKTPIFRCHIDEKELAKFKDGYFKHLEFRRKFGSNGT